ncbi:MAG: right-handed parallel beta-helix repeat-containing protein [Acidobacteria bacterium]|nr:right-handed parallel beta-helix repeat-containing protein [Acidobacteriota bacterium]
MRISIAAAILAAVPVTFWYDWFYGRLGLLAPQSVIEHTKGGRVIKVPPGGNIQAALEQATSGDVVELQAGATYNGQVSLPSKALTDYVTIRSSRYSELPDGKRVSPADKDKMATIVAGMAGRAAVKASDGANHFRFVGIEFTASSVTFNYGVVVLGNEEKRPDRVPHDIEIDRSYIHPSGNTVARRGIALNSASTTIKNSYISGFGFAEQETQGICGWSGTRDIKILNNYVEGGAENIMFGGSDIDNADLIPTNVEVRGNHLSKPKAWATTAAVKTLFEIKNAKNVTFAGNYLENNWKGSAFRITVRNQDGGSPFSTIEDVVVRDNVVKGSGDGINILGKDDAHASMTLRRLDIENNLFLDIVGANDGFDGSGYFVQASDGESITIANNTVFNRGNIATIYDNMPRGFVMRDNIVGLGAYGVHAALDMKGDQARTMFSGNIFMNLNGVGDGDAAIPAGNTVVRGPGDVRFSDLSNGDYRLADNSKFRGKGADLAPLGAIRSSVSE